MTPKISTICFIGFGELGQRFARDLNVNDRLRISTYDIKFDNVGLKGEIERAALALGVMTARDIAIACRDADVVISAVTADQTELAAKNVAAFLQAGQIYLDVNSASPSTKKRAAAAVEKSGASYVEGAVMAPVLKPGIRVPILAGGPHAQAVTNQMNALGMNLTAVSQEHGRASAIKLCRSIIIKGLEVLMVDCSQASRYWGVEKDVFGSLDASYPSIDWANLAEDMCERVATHGVRRSAEMREAAAMLADMHFNPDLIQAVADAQLRGALRGKA